MNDRVPTKKVCELIALLDKSSENFQMDDELFKYTNICDLHEALIELLTYRKTIDMIINTIALAIPPKGHDE